MKQIDLEIYRDEILACCLQRAGMSYFVDGSYFPISEKEILICIVHMTFLEPDILCCKVEKEVYVKCLDFLEFLVP